MCGDIKEHADNVAHHFIEKTISFKFKTKASFLFNTFEACDSAYSCFNAAAHIGKGGKVMLSNEFAECFF